MDCVSTLAPATDCEALDNQMDRLIAPILAGSRVQITAGSLTGLPGRAVSQDAEDRWLVEIPGQGAYLRIAAGSLAVK